MKSNTEKIAAYFEEWLKESGTVPYGPEDMIEFAAYVMEREEKDKIEPFFFRTDWPEVNTTLLVNLLRLPENHQKSLIDSMFERRPELFSATNYWQSRCILAEIYLTASGHNSDKMEAHEEYQEFLKNNKQP